MKAGISFLLGLLLTFMVIFGWLRTSHPLGTRWNSVDRGLAHVGLAEDPTGR